MFTSIGKDATNKILINTQGRKDVMTIKFAFTVKEVTPYLDTVQHLLPEHSYTDARHIAEYCYIHCDSTDKDDVNKGIHHYYEIFDLTKPSTLSEPSY